jgi:hypothetical protein
VVEFTPGKKNSNFFFGSKEPKICPKNKSLMMGCIFLLLFLFLVFSLVWFGLERNVSQGR